MTDKFTCFCGEPLTKKGYGLYPYPCKAQDKHPQAMIYAGCKNGHTGWTYDPADERILSKNRKDKEMTTKQFIVEHTGKPFASAVPDGTPWYEFSKHRTLSAAMKRIKKEQALCRKNSGSWTWDDCYRIRKPDGTFADWSDWYEFENHIG